MNSRCAGAMLGSFLSSLSPYASMKGKVIGCECTGYLIGGRMSQLNDAILKQVSSNASKKKNYFISSNDF